MNMDTHSDRVARLTELDPTLNRTQAVKLIETVARHALRWEVWPERHIVSAEAQQVGFELDLLGQHAPHTHPLAPGCEVCQEVYAALRDVADFLIPKGLHPSRYDIEPFDGALRYANPSSEGYVTLKLRILHRDGFFDPPDACEVTCLTEMEAKLHALGATNGARNLGHVPSLQHS